MMFRRTTIVSIVLIIVATLIIGCSPKPDVPVIVEDVTVRITALRGPTGIGLVSMIENNPSLGAHVKAEYQVAETPDIAVSRVLSKEADIVALPTNLAAKLYTSGSGYQLLAVNTWGNLYVVSKGIEINSWDDFRGKTINSIGIGATPDLLFRFLLQENGLNPETDVTIDYTMSQVELASALIAGKITLAVLPEPLVTTVTMRNNELSAVLDLEEEWKKIKGDVDIAQGCLVVREEFVSKHPQVVEAFLAEYQRSMDWVNENLEEAGVLVEKHSFGMPAAVAQRAIPRSNISYMGATQARGAIESYLQVLLTMAPQAVGGKLPDEGFYYKAK